MLVARGPSLALSPHVEQLWYCEGYQAAHRKERVLPSGRFQMVIELADLFIRQWDRDPGSDQFEHAPPAVVVGMQSRYGVIDTAALQSVIGVVFRPGGARAFFDVPAEEFYNQSVPLDLVWGNGAGALRERLQDAATGPDKLDVLDAGLRERLQSRHSLHGAVRFALLEFGRMPHTRTILEVTRDAGLSRRRFAQLFREQVGLTPKLYCRIRRFQRVLRQIRSGCPVDWADVALGGGYYDQAHLGHEFHEFSGISPGAYLTGERPYPNHVPMD
jgi:AraC-like DNA-binding protein